MKKKVTIQDIADQASVSKTTVSYYLNGKYEKMSEETKIKIESVIKKNKYRPNTIAQSLKSKKSKIIGIIVADISLNFSNLLVKGVENITEDKDYQLIVCSSNFEYRREKNYVNKMIDMGVDGIIIQATNEFFIKHKKIIKEECPIIFVDSINTTIQSDSVYVKTNDYLAVDEAVKKLLKMNYEKFIYITPATNSLHVRQERLDGFIDAAKKYNLNHTIVEYSSAHKLIESLNSLIESKTLIFCANGKTAQAAYHVLKEIDKNIPDEIGFITFDKWDWTKYTTPKITTIDQQNYLEGQITAEKMLKMFAGKEVDSTELKTKIFWESSTQ